MTRPLPLPDLTASKKGKRGLVANVVLISLGLVLLVISLGLLFGAPVEVGDGTATEEDATLGGTRADFEAALGAEVHFIEPWTEDLAINYRPCPGGGTSTEVSAMFAGGRAYYVDRSLCEGRMTPERAQEEARAFMPADAVLEGTFTTSWGEEAIRFRSDSLAVSLPSDARPELLIYRDCDGNAVAPGTFSLTVGEESWYLIAGLCP